MVLPVMSVRAFAAAQPSTKVGPVVEKTVTDNGNGTHKIKLELTGKVNTTHEVTKANVLVVLDLSASMNEKTGGYYSNTRLEDAKDAVNSVAETLLGLNTEENPDLVEMGLITFSDKAETEKFGYSYNSDTTTTSLSQFENKVTSLSAEGGTNWEDALVAAKNFDFIDKDKTYVIFVSDGNPTFRNTQISNARLPRSDNEYWDHSYYDYYGNTGDDYYNKYKNDDLLFRSEGIYGLGADSPDYVNYSLTSMKRCYNAALSAAKEVVKEKDLYGIGIYGNAAWVENLINESGAGNDHYFAANDTAALNESLKNIANIITTSLKQHDVKVTDGVTSLSTISANVAGNLEGFIYKKNDQEWTDAPKAKIENNKVVWDLSSVGSLENGVKYSVEFNVWPSQAAFDLVADLNNGKQTYDSLEEAKKKQLTKDNNGNYFLKTNTDLKTNFKYNDEDQEEEFDPGNSTMEVQSSKISLVKLWDVNNVDERKNEDVTLILKKDGQDYLTEELNEKNEFKADNIYVAPGIIINGEVLEKGHDYSVTESGDNAYHWELNADTYHPMLINGTLTMLKKDDKGNYTIDGKKYSVVDDADATLKAKNSRRSYLNFKKVVNEAQEGTAKNDDSFTYKVTITDPKGNDIWFSVKDENEKYVTNSVTGATKDGNYYKVASGVEFTVKLKKDWNFRAINLLSNTTYSIEETDIPDGYVFENYQINEGSINVAGNKVTGTIAAANKAYNLTNTNKYNGYFYVYHSSNNQVEKVSITDPRVVDGKFDLTKEVSNGYLYGGYFKAYGQTTSTDEDIKKLNYIHGKAKDQENGTPYTGAKATAWKSVNAYTDNGQIEFKPQVNKVYYLKEVPNTYFRPRMEIIYDTYNAEKPVTDLYLFTAVDDANYNSVSLNNENNTKLYLRATIRNYNGTVKRYLTVKGEFKSLSLPRGYIALINVKDKVKKQEKFEYTPTYETLDGVKVSGVVKRRVDFGNGRFKPDSETGDSIAPGLSHSDIEN